MLVVCYMFCGILFYGIQHHWIVNIGVTGQLKIHHLMLSAAIVLLLY